jgi:hypothetical protein
LRRNTGLAPGSKVLSHEYESGLGQLNSVQAIGLEDGFACGVWSQILSEMRESVHGSENLLEEPFVLSESTVVLLLHLNLPIFGIVLSSCVRRYFKHPVRQFSNRGSASNTQTAILNLLRPLVLHCTSYSDGGFGPCAQSSQPYHLGPCIALRKREERSRI